MNGKVQVVNHFLTSKCHNGERDTSSASKYLLIRAHQTDKCVRHIENRSACYT